jgi:hypothetical protein
MEAQLVQLLAPFLPQLMAGAGEQVKEIGGEIVELTWAHVKKIWDRLRPAVESKPAAQEAAVDVSKAPDDPKARTVLEVQLEKLLAEDKGLAAALATLLDDARRDGVGGNVTVEGNVVATAKDGGISIGVVGRDANVRR